MGFSVFTFDFGSMFDNLDDFVQPEEIEVIQDVAPQVIEAPLEKAEAILTETLLENEISTADLNAIILSANTDYIPPTTPKVIDQKETKAEEAKPVFTPPVSTNVSKAEEYRKAIEALIKILQTSVIYNFQSSDVVSMALSVKNQMDFSKDNNAEGFDKDKNKYASESDRQRLKYDILQEELRIARLRSNAQKNYI